MSLTGPDHVYVALHQSGFQKLLTAICTARPRLLHYSKAVSPSTATTSALLTSQIENIDLAIPVADLSPDDGVLVTGIAASGPDMFTLHAPITLDSLTPDLLVQLRMTVSAAPKHVGFIAVAADNLSHGTWLSTEIWSGVLVPYLNNAILAGISIPVASFFVGLVTVTVTHGPQVAANQVELWGDVL
jgi:hypothetical protein